MVRMVRAHFRGGGHLTRLEPLGIVRQPARGAGLTKLLRAVLAVLAAAGRPLSAAEVRARLAEGGRVCGKPAVAQSLSTAARRGRLLKSYDKGRVLYALL